MGSGSLDGKVAIVTGGAQILGAGVVAGLHEAGSKVVIADINAELGAAVAADLGDGVAFVETNITDDAQLDALVQSTVDLYGGIDILVNAAATYLDNRFDTTRDEWHEALDINLGLACCSLARLPTTWPHEAGAR